MGFLIAAKSIPGKYDKLLNSMTAHIGLSEQTLSTNYGVIQMITSIELLTEVETNELAALFGLCLAYRAGGQPVNIIDPILRSGSPSSGNHKTLGQTEFIGRS
jgi:hypothetical protein